MKNLKTFIAGLLTGVAILGITDTMSAGSLLKKIEAYIVDQPIVVNGEKAVLKNPVLTYNNTRYVNLRDMATLLGSDIEYSKGVINLKSTERSTNATDINTNTTVPESTENENVTNEESQTVSDQPFLKMSDVYSKLKNDYYATDYQKSRIMSGVRMDNVYVEYMGSTYPTSYDDYYYDRMTDETYFTKDFFLKFLSPSDVDSLSAYSIDFENQKVAKFAN